MSGPSIETLAAIAAQAGASTELEAIQFEQGGQPSVPERVLGSEQFNPAENPPAAGA